MYPLLYFIAGILVLLAIVVILLFPRVKNPSLVLRRGLLLGAVALALLFVAGIVALGMENEREERDRVSSRIVISTSPVEFEAL